MAVGAFPLIKLGALAIKQVAKPLANVLKARAKKSPFFRTYICMPPAQIYHWIEVNVKMKMLNLGKPREVQKLNEAMAIELGAELLGETIIFVVGAAVLTAEYVRQSRKSAQESEQLEQRWNSVENRIQELEFLVNKHSAEIREISRIAYAVQSSIKPNDSSSYNEGNGRGSNEDKRSKSIITKAVDDAKDTLAPGRSK